MICISNIPQEYVCISSDREVYLALVLKLWNVIPKIMHQTEQNVNVIIHCFSE
jgi:hypothetical protein